MSGNLDRTGAQSPPTDVVEVTDVEGTLSTDTRGPIRLGLWVLVVGFGGFLLWAALAPLDEGVVAPGSVAIETRLRVIQHMTGGVVKKVAVKEGDQVRAGDMLIELEDAAAKANYETVRQNYMGLRATESRLLAEQTGAAQITFHPDLLAGADDPLVRQHMATQVKLFTARREALSAELAAARDSIVGFEAQATGFANMIESRKAQQKIQEEQIASIRSLAAEGYAPRNQVLQLEQSQAELRSVIAELQANRQRALQGASETKMRMAQRREEYQKEVGASLADVRRDVQAGEDKLRAVGEELARTNIKSPVDGQVIGLAVSSVGGVVTPGQKLMDVVPKGEPLLIDARIPPHVIDRVQVGNITDVRFSGFSHTPQLVVEARLVSLSKDVITDPRGPQLPSYYLGRVEVTDQGRKALGDRVMQSGMPAEVLIRTGGRSLLTYLLRPLVQRVSGAMKEE